MRSSRNGGQLASVGAVGVERERPDGVGELHASTRARRRAVAPLATSLQEARRPRSRAPPSRSSRCRARRGRRSRRSRPICARVDRRRCRGGRRASRGTRALTAAARRQARSFELRGPRAVAPLPGSEEQHHPLDVPGGQRARPSGRAGGRAHGRGGARAGRRRARRPSRGAAAGRGGRSSVRFQTRTCSGVSSSGKQVVTSTERKVPGRSAMRSAPSSVLWSLIVTRSMPRARQVS